MKVKDSRPLALFAISCLLSTGSAFAGTYGGVTIDGELDDWDATQSLNSDSDVLYGKYEAASDPVYLLALQTTGTSITAETTVWLNSDNDVTTGYRIWGTYGGAEYYINIYSDGRPYLYSGDPFGTFISGPLEHSYSTDKTALEIVLPASLIGSPPESISLIGDLNNAIFLPNDYASGQFSIYHEPTIIVPPEPVIETYGNIDVDGAIDDWSPTERINLPLDLPPTLVDNKENIYAKYVSSPETTYVFAIETSGTIIGPETTFWLNTDNDAYTGYQIWGAYGGAEYYVNISSDNKPYLYKGDPFGEFVAGPLTHHYSADSTILEFALPASLIGSPQEKVSLIGDLDNKIFLPSDYSTGQFSVLNQTMELPPRTDFSKRVGIVYSETSKTHFFDAELPIQKAYSQLFMAMQHQSMMAGIPFDLLSEDDLTDISRLVNYDALIFPSFSSVPSDRFEAIHDTLYQAVYHYGIGIITAGDWMTNGSDGISIEGDAYRHMKQILGIGRVTGEGPVEMTLNAGDTTHPAMDDYRADEIVYSYANNHWYSYFSAATDGTLIQPVTTLATQTVTGSTPGTYDAVLAVETGARHVHFSSLEFMGDTNLLWTALQWSIYGDESPVALKMGRFNNLFISRNDMDQSQEIAEVAANDGALLPILQQWKSDYGFVGSYFINIGNNPPDQYTDWSYSAPLYQQYIALGNEIGTHSFTHPHDTNVLTAAGVEFEFDQAMDIIAEQLNPTWRDQNIRGAAVPGAPEGTETALEILQYLDYLTGGYSSVGAGYPGAFGYLTPTSDKIYLSPNMSFDFTLIEYGIPVYDTDSGQWVPQPLSAAEAEQHWLSEYTTLMRHASLPIIHWPWHDYGPTTGTTDLKLYTLSMFTNTIKTAYEDNAEFLTSIDAAQRMETFKEASLTVTQSGTTTNVNVSSHAVGKFALEIDLSPGNVIESVDNWYAYDDRRVFLDQDGGDFTIHQGAIAANVTHITALPMRAELLSLSGDGNTLAFTLKGEGKVRLALADRSNRYKITGADTISKIDDNTIELTFNSFDVHTVFVGGK